MTTKAGTGRLHLVAVEEVTSPNFYGPDSWGFRAVCIDTGTECDAYGFILSEYGVADTEAEAIANAVSYLSDPSLHRHGSPHFCPARHVLIGTEVANDEG